MVRGGAILGHLRMKQKSGVGKEEVSWWFTKTLEQLINWQFSFDSNHVSKKKCNTMFELHYMP